MDKKLSQILNILKRDPRPPQTIKSSVEEPDDEQYMVSVSNYDSVVILSSYSSSQLV